MKWLIIKTADIHKISFAGQGENMFREQSLSGTGNKHLTKQKGRAG